MTALLAVEEGTLTAIRVVMVLLFLGGILSLIVGMIKYCVRRVALPETFPPGHKIHREILRLFAGGVFWTVVPIAVMIYFNQK